MLLKKVLWSAIYTNGPKVTDCHNPLERRMKKKQIMFTVQG